MSCFYLMTELGYTNWLRFLIWLVVGLVIYICYSYEHSLLGEKTSPYHKSSKKIASIGGIIAAVAFAIFYMRTSVLTGLLYGGLAGALGFLFIYVTTMLILRVFQKGKIST